MGANLLEWDQILKALATGLLYIPIFAIFYFATDYGVKLLDKKQQKRIDENDRVIDKLLQ